MSILGALASGRARASWRWKTAAAVVPTLVAFLLQWYVLNASMARWALFYPAVFVASWALARERRPLTMPAAL